MSFRVYKPEVFQGSLKNKNLIYNDTSKRADLEVIDKFFEYF
jgi:hypothetical protein